MLGGLLTASWTTREGRFSNSGCWSQGRDQQESPGGLVGVVCSRMVSTGTGGGGRNQKPLTAQTR